MIDTSTNNIDPKNLMQLAKEGNKEAFGQLYQAYYVPVFRYIYLRLGNKEDTKDLVQNVFLKVYQSIESYQEQGQNPLAYFFTVARNTVIDHLRKKKPVSLDDEQNQAHQIQSPKDDPEELFQKDEITKLIRKATSKLNEAQQEVIILKFINEFSNSEISKLIGKSEEAIRQIQHRALLNLKEHLKEINNETTK